MPRRRSLRDLAAFALVALGLACVHPSPFAGPDRPYLEAYALAYADYRHFVRVVHGDSRTGRCLAEARLDISVFEEDGGVVIGLAPRDGRCCSSFGKGGCGVLTDDIAFEPDGGLRVRHRTITSTFDDE